MDISGLFSSSLSLIFYSFIVFIFCGVIRVVFRPKKNTIILIAFIFSILIYFGLNFSKIIEEDLYFISLFNSFIIFLSTIGIAQLGGHFLRKDDYNDDNEPYGAGDGNLNEKSRFNFFSKWL